MQHEEIDRAIATVTKCLNELRSATDIGVYEEYSGAVTRYPEYAEAVADWEEVLAALHAARRREVTDAHTKKITLRRLRKRRRGQLSCLTQALGVIERIDSEIAFLEQEGE